LRKVYSKIRKNWNPLNLPILMDFFFPKYSNNSL
jgi:hypothetical protein